MKDLSGTIPGAIHHKVINEGGYGKDITVGSALILANVSVFSPKPSMYYLNITMRNVVKIFYKDSVPDNGSGVGGSGMLMEEKDIVKLMKEEEMADLELNVCGNVIDQEDLYKFDEEALNLVLKEEARQAQVDQEWLEKCRQEEELDEEHERQLWGFYETFANHIQSEGGGALGSLGALKPSIHPVIAIFLPLGAEVEAACALKVEAVGALDLVKVEAVGALDVVGLSLNILISASEAEYASLNKAKYASLNKAKYDRLIPSEICIQAEYDIIKRNMSVCLQAKYDRLSSETVNSFTEASGSKPRSNTKNNRNLPAKSVNQKTVEDHPMKNKFVWTKVNRVDSSISSKRVNNSELQSILCGRLWTQSVLLYRCQFCDSDLEILSESITMLCMLAVKSIQDQIMAVASSNKLSFGTSIDHCHDRKTFPACARDDVQARNIHILHDIRAFPVIANTEQGMVKSPK
ncbi:GPCR kinase [Tanacetum coccineum]